MGLIGVCLIIVTMITVALTSKPANSTINPEEPSGTLSQGDYYIDEFGEKIYTGNAELTAEDVVYGYVKSLSLLDFTTALTYLNCDSSVINGYIDRDYSYEGVDSGSSISYNFTHKIYKQVLLNMVIDSIVDKVIMPDNYIITLKIKHLDLNNTEFWKVDKEEIFNKLMMYKLDTSETSEDKANEYLANYIKGYFDKPEAPTKISEIEIKLDKTMSGAWLISDEVDLYGICSYNDGSLIITDINESFNEWYDGKISEQEAE